MTVAHTTYHFGGEFEEHGFGSCHSFWVSLDPYDVTLLVVRRDYDRGTRLSLDTIHW